MKYPLTFHVELTHAKALAATLGVWIGTMVLTMAFFLRPEPPDDEGMSVHNQVGFFSKLKKNLKRMGYHN